MGSLRLALVTPRFWPLIDDRSLHTLRLAEALREAGQDVTVVTARWSKSWPEQMQVGPLTLMRLPGDGLGGLGTMRWMYALASWLRSHTPDATLITGLKHEAFAALGSARRAAGVTLLMAGEDCLAWQRSSLLGSQVAARCRERTPIVAPTEAIAERLVAAGYDPALITVIPSGAIAGLPPSVHARNAARAALAAVNYDLATTEKACVALAIGRLDEAHRFGDLIRAWRIVTARRSEARLWMIGDGPERERLYRQIGDLDQRFRAFLPGTFECHQELLAACNVLLVPGAHDAPPLALLDALAAGVPVIAADTPAARQCMTVGSTGRIYPMGDAKVLATEILRVMELDDRTTPCTARQTPRSEAAAYLTLIERLRS